MTTHLLAEWGRTIKNLPCPLMSMDANCFWIMLYFNQVGKLKTPQATFHFYSTRWQTFDNFLLIRRSVCAFSQKIQNFNNIIRLVLHKLLSNPKPAQIVDVHYGHMISASPSTSISKNHLFVF